MRHEGRLEETIPKMCAVQIPGAGRPFELVEREIPEPGAGWVGIRVQACGICHPPLDFQGSAVARSSQPCLFHLILII
jgi:D-arabinose 1-dehydrogenase-like Zn-dependent alcohol dehydrogenase